MTPPKPDLATRLRPIADALDAQRWFCNKCGQVCESGPEHPGCNYHSWPVGPSDWARDKARVIREASEELEALAGEMRRKRPTKEQLGMKLAQPYVHCDDVDEWAARIAPEQTPTTGGSK